MANRIFIPELQKQYTLSDDTNILLYPWNEHPDKDIVTQHFYAQQKKGNFVFKADRKVVPFIGNEDYFSQHGKDSMTVVDWYLVSDIDFPDSIKSIIKSPYDLQKLDNKGVVYIHLETVAGWVNRRFYAFINKRNEQKTYADYIAVKKNLIVKDIKPLDINTVEVVNTNAISHIKLLNPCVDKMLKNYIPVDFSIQKGSTFTLNNVKYKHPTTKIELSSITINGNEIGILPEQLNNFVLE